MTSDRQRASNRCNACLSSGPRTLAGKLRSRNNAIRHGLATPISQSATLALEIELLAKRLAGFDNDFWQIEHARIIAESHFDLRRIRAARTEVVRRLGG